MITSSSERGKALTKQEEGLRLRVYKDSNGFDTIAYGHKLEQGEYYPEGINQEKADELFEHDSAIADAFVVKYANQDGSLTQGQFDCLHDFVFNVGVVDFKQML